MFGLTNNLGIAAGILTSVSLLPQLIKMVRERKATDISPVMLLILLSGLCLWVVYGFMKKDWPVICTNVFSFLLNITIIALRFYYMHQNRK